MPYKIYMQIHNNKMVSLCLQDEPVKFINKPRGTVGLTPTLTGDLELSCEVSSASAVVVWKRGQVEIKEDQRASMVSKGTQRRLIIKKAKKTDEGQYSCETATDKVTFQVKIKGKNTCVLLLLIGFKYTHMNYFI